MRWLLLCTLMTSGLAIAQPGGRRGKPQDYEATELTDEEREAARVRARYRMGTWHEADPAPPEPKFPWMPLGITLLTFAIVAPFAWNAYRGTARELTSNDAFGARRPRKPAARD